MKKGKDNPNYRSGKTHDSNGYIILSSSEWGEYQGKREHRYVMETHLGRKLERHEVVHHKDGNKSNNLIDNLEVKTRAEHNREHSKGAELICSKCGKKRWYGPRLSSMLRQPYMCRKCYRGRITMKTQKLSDKDACTILELRLSGVKGTVLAEQYGVSTSTICDIYKGRKHK